MSAVKNPLQKPHGAANNGEIEAFEYNALPGRVVFGAGRARSSLSAEVEQMGLQRLMLIADAFDADLARELVAPLGQRCVTTFDKVRQHVPVEVVREACKQAKDKHVDGLLSVGGGSTTGLAKAVALELDLPIICIPTTYAGSEMTPVWGMTENNRKTTGRSMKVLPKLVIYDPELTYSLPDTITGPSAINAVAHCVEAFYAAGACPMASLMALEGIRAIANGLQDAVLNPRGLSGRAKTLYGAYLGGATFAVAGSGIHHKICHVLGGAYDLPHAELHTIILPHAVAINRDAIPDIMARIADALGADDAADGLFDLGRDVGAPAALSAIGMKAEDLDEAVQLCLAAVPANNPAQVSEAMMRQLLSDAFEGNRPHHY